LLAADLAPARLHGAGATFPQPAYAAWSAQYRHESGTEIAYDAVGSGEGVARVERGATDFGATDAPLDLETLARQGLFQFPAVIGAVVPVVNVPGIGAGQLKLTGQVLADIYLGKVRRWNDPAIAALNPGLALPPVNITVVHRADPSGTTFLWSDYLSKVDARWQSAIGAATTLDWPVGVGGIGNEGVASYVQRTRASIGYVEYAYARQHKLTGVSLRNREGAFVQPGKASFMAAVAAAPWHRAADLHQVLTNEPGAASWPIMGASFILLPLQAGRAERSMAAMAFFAWAMTAGQDIAEGLGYVPVPTEAVALVRQGWREHQPSD
jgi:phosphate transport system substrate-binding protein